MQDPIKFDVRESWAATFAANSSYSTLTTTEEGEWLETLESR